MMYMMNPILSSHKYPHLMMMLSLMSMGVSLALFQADTSFILEWSLVTINSASISFPIMLEANSMLFMFTVSFISFNVLIFSKLYMMGDMNIQRFTQMVMMFISSMMMLILSPNIMMMLIGWDGLGITSFLLVIYYENNRSLKSGFITLTTNRIGDCLILLAVAIISSQGHWNMFNMWEEETQLSYLVTALILVAAMTKSAQLPFMGWLTCAMAAPTPVSALVHSSTLVTAGVFMLIRFYPFLSNFPYFTPALTTTGMLTMVVGAGFGIVKKDIKEVVALSTMSQLGLMMLTLSMGMADLCFFHMLTHAMFKATIFMAVGMVIMFKGHRQNFSNVKNKIYARTIAVSMFISLLSMNALFFTAGYYSKDTILETIWYSPTAIAVVVAYAAGTWMTMTYTTRIWRGTISTKIKNRTFFRKSFPQHLIKTHIMGNHFTLMEFPLLMMTIMTLSMGSTTMWLTFNPSDTPIVPSELQFFSSFLVVGGWMMAAFFCPSNKAKSPFRTGWKMFMKWDLKSYKWKFKKPPTQASLTSFKQKMKYMTLLPKSILWKWKKKSKEKTPRIKSLEVDSLGAMKFRKTSLFIKAHYKLAAPFLKLSTTIEKTLDLGMYMFFGPTTISKTLPKLSSSLMIVQNMSMNKFLIMFLLVSVMSFFIIYGLEVWSVLD